MWEESNFSKKIYSPRVSHSKAASFTELSDWGNKHRYLNQSIVLPRILEEQAPAQRNQRIMGSHSTDSMKRRDDKSAAKSVDIKFGLPQRLKGFQKSFYENYIKEKSTKKGSQLSQSQYVSLQNKLRSIGQESNSIKSE